MFGPSRAMNDVQGLGSVNCTLGLNSRRLLSVECHLREPFEFIHGGDFTMKPKQMMLFAVAIGCGLVAMLGAQQILSGSKTEEQEKIKILVAKTDIDPGIPLDKTNVGFKEWPKDAVPEGAIIKEEEFAEHALRHRVSAGFPILIPELGPKGAFGVNSMIPKGMQVVSLPVDATMTHSGLLRAGSFVDITCAIDRQGQAGAPTKTIVRTVLKRVRVFAVGDKVSGSDGVAKDGTSAEVKVISFVVFQNQAKLLNHARVVSNNRLYTAMLGEAGQIAADARDFDEDSYAAAANELSGDKAPDLLNNVPNSAKADTLAKQRPSASSFSEYVKQQPVVAEVADLGKGPTRATWKIEIYSGDTKKIHELELPEQAPAVRPRSPTLGGQWTAPLMQFFSTRKRSRKPTVEETQTTPSEDVRPDSSNDKSAEIPAETVRQ